MDNIEKLKNIFSENKQLYLWIVEYGITHEVITFALHKGIFPKRIEVMCMGSKYFSGQLKGGPYSLNIEEESGIIVIRGIDTDLLIEIEKITKIAYVHGGF